MVHAGPDSTPYNCSSYRRMPAYLPLSFEIYTGFFLQRPATVFAIECIRACSGSRTSSRRRRSSSSRSQERVSQDGNTIQMEHTSAADSDSDINSSKLTHREAQDVVTRLLSQALKPQLATTSDTEPLTKRASSTIKQQPSQSNGSN